MDISVVIPVYNSEKTVDETIQSVVNQGIFGSATVEIIIVNDGSTDGSDKIIDSWHETYPESIKVVHQPNMGVASARNTGIREARGAIVGFLDSDDYYSENALSDVLEFFGEHGDDVDLAAIPIMMFGHVSRAHSNNKSRFDETGIINVEENWHLPHMGAGGTFVKRQTVIEHDLFFNENLSYAEDSLFNTNIILRKMAYGAISTSTYYYRRVPLAVGSLVSRALEDPVFYDEVLEATWGTLLEESRTPEGTVPRYVQSVIAYDLVNRLRNDTDFLEETVFNEYKGRVQKILTSIDADVIMSQNGPIDIRLNMVDMSQNFKLLERATFDDGKYYLDDSELYSYISNAPFRHPSARWLLKFKTDLGGDEYLIEGKINAVVFPGQVKFELHSGQDVYPLEIQRNPHRSRLSRSFTFDTGFDFTTRVKWKPNEPLALYAVFANSGEPQREFKLQFRAGRWSDIAGTPSSMYFANEGETFTLVSPSGTLIKRKATVPKLVRQELRFARKARSRRAGLRTLALRAQHLLKRNTSKSSAEKPLWLFTDLKERARDNAEAFFRYVAEHQSHRVRPVFVLREDSPDYEELSKVGEIVQPDSPEFNKIFLQADAVLNSAADSFMLLALGRQTQWLRDQISQTRIFLQHGVSLNDLSTWLNRDRKGFDYVVTNGPMERAEFLNGKYGYNEDQVVMSGSPRFDRLSPVDEKIIVFAPTWRLLLAGEHDQSTGAYRPNPKFEASEYFQRWQDIISDPKLNDYLAAKGYRGLFMIHPSHRAEADKFSPGPSIDVQTSVPDYKQVISKCTSMITDYSSIASDAAYIGKPVVYFQPDAESMYSSHTWKKSAFDYKKHGFGPVVETKDELVDEIFGIIQRGGKMEPAYESRTDSFFPNRDQKNSERLFNYLAERLLY